MKAERNDTRRVSRGRFFTPLLLVLMLSITSFAWAGETATSTNNGAPVAAEKADRGVMEGFRRDKIVLGEAVKISDKRKHTILFFMGVVLLTLIIGTAIVGVTMVISGKQLFVPHMIMAGLTVTLAIAHAVASTVWFFPF
ncbi:MAG: hypothetical protein GC138_05785 [Gammaproteobacteria bacterium]|nr:hypothetical protein [Gammaproteobacteria bacterium]